LGNKVASFSNKGKEAELCTPGHNIYSCVPGGDTKAGMEHRWHANTKALLGSTRPDCYLGY